jgi:hypothetical protein
LVTRRSARIVRSDLGRNAIITQTIISTNKGTQFSKLYLALPISQKKE